LAIEQFAKHFLLAGGLNGVGRGVEVERAPEANGCAALEMASKTKSGERPLKVNALWHGVGNAQLSVWSDMTEGVIEMIVPIGCDASGAKAVRCAASGQGAADGRDKVHRGIRQGEAQVGINVANAISRTVAGGRGGRRSVDEENGNTEIRSKMAIKVVAQSGIEARDGAEGTRGTGQALIPNEPLARTFLQLGAGLVGLAQKQTREGECR